MRRVSKVLFMARMGFDRWKGGEGMGWAFLYDHSGGMKNCFDNVSGIGFLAMLLAQKIELY